MNRGRASAAATNHGPSRLKIGDVAKRAGVNQQTLRYYERRGIIREPRRADSGYREYPADTVRLIRFIKRAQELGFTLDEVEELITLRDTKARRLPKTRALAVSKMAAIDQKLARLQAMRSALYNLIEDCACGNGSVACPILEALDDPEGPEGASQPDGDDGEKEPK